MAADGRVRITLPARYRQILQRHKGSMSDAAFLTWLLDNIDRGVLAIGAEPTSTALPLTMPDIPQPVALSVVATSDEDDEFEDVI